MGPSLSLVTAVITGVPGVAEMTIEKSGVVTVRSALVRRTIAEPG